MARDAHFDGAFVYAVRSTGVYCRPSCPSRRPTRGQVVFFERAAAAERAGFRPCRRCRPNASQPVAVEKVRRACLFLDNHSDGAASLATLGAHVGLSPYHLHRTFKRVMGVTPREYLEARRFERLKKHLRERPNVTHALYEAGFSSSSRLYERAPSKLGMTPARYRRGGSGVAIRYTIVASPLGRLLVAATDRGVCRIGMGESDRYLEKDLRREFPAAEILRDDAGLRGWSKALLEQLLPGHAQPDLPLDIQATAFQERVWKALRRIPAGRTRSYAEVARAIGQPRAVRAVGRACAANPVALLIPCHRVVESGGGLGGYHWGIERKRTLLAREKASAGSKGKMTSGRIN